ncbi:SGNH/GDSL hydrolase family protein [Streptomyces sp. ALB3]|uniref:SGNH/GDSL hydrolase family protein n=1 Tax=Streptomyces sp. ALB3 TaxID=3374278 RepID=UPI00379B58A5
MKMSRLVAFSSSLLLGTVLALTGVGVAQAQGSAQSAAVDYVALGDSYSSGVGAGSYDSASGGCKRSTRAYPVLWKAANNPASFAFTACSGARTGDVTAGQLGPLSSATDLVSISIGGNDAGFADVMTTCVLQSEATCLNRITTARAYVDSTLPGKLDSVYEAISARAPSAHVVVLGYPRFYKLGGNCVAGLSERERAAINGAADYLNTATAKRAADHGFTFGDVTPTFTGHEICSGSAWLHSVNWLNIGESYHPTAAGQSGGYLPVLTAKD